MPDEETILNEQEDELFGDDDLEWEDDDTEVEEKEPDDEQDDGLTVKYNGKEQKVGKDEIPTLVQKGLNYDHIQSELDSMRQGNMYKVLKKAADKEGMSVEQYAKFVLDREVTCNRRDIDGHWNHPSGTNIVKMVSGRIAAVGIGYEIRLGFTTSDQLYDVICKPRKGLLWFLYLDRKPHEWRFRIP